MAAKKLGPLTPADIDHITLITNTRGSQFAQPGLGPDPYTLVSTEVVSGGLQIDVKRQRTGSTFSDKEHGDELSDALINAVLTAIERRLQLKPAG